MFSLARWARRLSRRAQRQAPAARLIVEALETRCLLTTYTVTTTADILHDASAVTLRDALNAISTQQASGKAAAGTANNTILFAIGTQGSVQTINLTSAFPQVSHQVFLDAWSQGISNYSGPPLIVLNAATVSSSANILTLVSGSNGSTIRGLNFERFGSEAIVLRGTNIDQVLGDFLGTNQPGTARVGSNTAGILIDTGSMGNTIGGTTIGAANVIAANGPGVEIKDSGTSGNVVLGNLIGTNKTGSAVLGALVGVEIRSGATANTVGGSASGAANVIDANGPGVEIKDIGTSGNLVFGNLIGTNKSGSAYLSALAGVEIRGGATANTVGGTATGAANVIDANGPGVEIKDAGTSGNLVLGNRIGTDTNGDAYLSALVGVVIRAGATANTIGGSTSGAANVIDANGPGVAMTDSGTSGNLVLGNLIGTDASGTFYLHALAGVEINNAATANTVGGTTSGAANVIDSIGPGVEIKDQGTRANLVIGNRIGTDITGTVAIGNAVGVEIRQGATANTIGGTAAGAANLISGNNGPGVEIKDSGTSGNVVLGNLIGTDSSGTAALGNTGDGVLLRQGATKNTIGGTAAGSGNTIAFNTKGIVLVDNSTVGDSLLGNSIFSNLGIGIDLGNDGPTPNGANPRAFPNDGQNTPILTNATSSTISGTLTSVPKTTFRIEFFITPSGGTAAQGETFLGFVNTMTDSSGKATFSLSNLTIPTGSVLTATATNLSNGDTSEFSPGLTH